MKHKVADTGRRPAWETGRKIRYISPSEWISEVYVINSRFSDFSYIWSWLDAYEKRFANGAEMTCVHVRPDQIEYITREEWLKSHSNVPAATIR